MEKWTIIIRIMKEEHIYFLLANGNPAYLPVLTARSHFRFCMGDYSFTIHSRWHWRASNLWARNIQIYSTGIPRTMWIGHKLISRSTIIYFLELKTPQWCKIFSRRASHITADYLFLMLGRSIMQASVTAATDEHLVICTPNISWTGSAQVTENTSHMPAGKCIGWMYFGITGKAKLCCISLTINNWPQCSAEFTNFLHLSLGSLKNYQTPKPSKLKFHSWVSLKMDINSADLSATQRPWAI